MANLYETVPKPAFDRIKKVFEEGPGDLEEQILRILEEYPHLAEHAESLSWWIATVCRDVTWEAPGEESSPRPGGFFRCGRPGVPTAYEKGRNFDQRAESA